MEARAALLFDMTLPGCDDWVARHGERQLVDDHARQLFAAYIDALPETGGRKQHGVWRLAKLPEQRALRGAALNETRVIDLRSHALEEFVHPRQTRREHECAP